MNIGILGLGEVGQAIKQLYSRHRVFVRTRSRDQIQKNHIDILHVCIPYSSRFVTIVARQIKKNSPRLTIINSTVAPGTTAAIYQISKTLIVHSPINGVHPHLYKYLFIFPKIIGPINQKAYLLAAKHFCSLGLKVVKFSNPLNSELAKLLCTTYYAWNIIFQKWVHSLCPNDFNEVYTQWNQIYNLGYKKIKPNVIRPILKHIPGLIGGHCLIPNAKILQQFFKDDFSRFILKQNQRLK